MAKTFSVNRQSGGGSRPKDGLSLAEVVALEDFDTCVSLLEEVDGSSSPTKYGRVTVTTSSTPVQFSIPANSIVRISADGVLFSYAMTAALADITTGSSPKRYTTRIRNPYAEAKVIYVDAAISGTVISWEVVRTLGITA